MYKGKAFVVVGHSHWGKSFTLNALTERYGGGWKKRSVTIKQEKIPVKKMSNDDRPVEDLIRFIKGKTGSQTQTIIIPLCPNFLDYRKKETEKLLNILRVFYDAYFIVLKKAQGSGDLRELQRAEIMELRKYGKVEEVHRKLDKYVRAERFKKFIEKFL